MTTQSNPEARKPKVGDDVIVRIGAVAIDLREVMIDGYHRWIPCSAFRYSTRETVPPPLSDTAQRVVEAAMAWREDHTLSPEMYPSPATRELAIATDAHLATLRPADPLAEIIPASEILANAKVRYTLAMEREAKAERGPLRTRAEEEVGISKMVLTAAYKRWDAACAAILLIERGGKGEG